MCVPLLPCHVAGRQLCAHGNTGRGVAGRARYSGWGWQGAGLGTGRSGPVHCVQSCRRVVAAWLVSGPGWSTVLQYGKGPSASGMGRHARHSCPVNVLVCQNGVCDNAPQCKSAEHTRLWQRALPSFPIPAAPHTWPFPRAAPKPANTQKLSGITAGTRSDTCCASCIGRYSFFAAASVLK